MSGEIKPHVIIRFHPLRWLAAFALFWTSCAAIGAWEKQSDRHYMGECTAHHKPAECRAVLEQAR